MSNNSTTNLVSRLPVQNSNGTALEDVAMNYNGNSQSSASPVLENGQSSLLPDSNASLSSSAPHMKGIISVLVEEIKSLTVELVTDPSNKSTQELDDVRYLFTQKARDLNALKSSHAVIVPMIENPVVSRMNPTTTDQQKFFVLPNLPVFQWPGSTFDSNMSALSDVKACLRKFENILKCHGLNLDEHWFRLILPCLSNDQQIWLEEIVGTFRTPFNWAKIKEVFVGHYGSTMADVKTVCTSELLDIYMYPKESIEAYINRFNSLARRSGIIDKLVLTSKFVVGLPKELNQVVNVAICSASPEKKMCLNTIAAISRDLYNKLFCSSASSLSFGHSHRDSAAPTKESLGVQGRTNMKKKYCNFHKTHGKHSTEECKSAKKAAAIKTARAKNQCFKCGASPWSKAHVCKTGSAVGERVMQAMSVVDDASCWYPFCHYYDICY
ncbi:hypothetical protein G6F43_010937 [Rhizopus delemar]|nr:hypothetical protein G6F43_010937 [Rhizopus delemar]